MIDLQPSPEQEQIIASVAGLLADQLPLDRLRPNPTPVANADRAQWGQLGAIGTFGLGLGEEQGGVGYSVIEEVLVFREFGRFLLSPSVLATTLAAHVAALAGNGDLAAAIQTGEEPVGLAIAFAPEAATLEGVYHLVDADAAHWILAWNESGMGLVAAETWRDRASVAGIDSTIVLERARLGAGSPALWVAASDNALPRRALLLTSAYLVGIAEAACGDSVEYAKVREQFGQPIGAFQAVKHRCADMMARASAAWNLTVFAALTVIEGAQDAPFQAIAAKVMAADAAFRNAAVNIQNHGGIGFTGEHHAHLYVKRAHLFDRLGGDMGVQKKRLLAQPPVFQGNAVNLA